VHNLDEQPSSLALAVEGTRAAPLVASDGARGTREGPTVQLELPPHASAAFRL